MNLGDSNGEPKNRTSRHSAKSTVSRSIRTPLFQVKRNFDVTEPQAVRRSRNAGHQAGVRSISVGRSRQIGRQTGCIGGIIIMVGFMSVVFEVLGVADL